MVVVEISPEMGVFSIAVTCQPNFAWRQRRRGLITTEDGDMFGILLIGVAVLLKMNMSVYERTTLGLHSYHAKMLGELVLLLDGQVLVSEKDDSTLRHVS